MSTETIVEAAEIDAESINKLLEDVFGIHHGYICWNVDADNFRVALLGQTDYSVGGHWYHRDRQRMQSYGIVSADIERWLTTAKPPGFVVESDLITLSRRPDAFMATLVTDDKYKMVVLTRVYKTLPRQINWAGDLLMTADEEIPKLYRFDFPVEDMVQFAVTGSIQHGSEFHLTGWGLPRQLPVEIQAFHQERSGKLAVSSMYEVDPATPGLSDS